jgi:hypothetical protein
LPNYKKSLILYHNVGIQGKLLKNESRVQQESLTWSLGKMGRFEKVSKHCRHNGPQFMILTKKNLSLLVIIGILVSGIPVSTLCSSYCVSNNLDLDSPMDGSCPFSYHSFFQIAIVLSAFFVLPLAGLFLVRDRQLLPPGVYLPLFKPPRFSH